MRYIRKIICAGLACCLFLTSFAYAKTGETKISDTLIIVNETHKLTKDYVPEDMKNLPKPVKVSNSSIYMQAEAADACAEMIKAMNAAGINDCILTSGYRAYETQQRLHNNKIAYYRSIGQNAQRAVKTASAIVAPPGASEHQTGLAADFTTRSMGGLLNNRFAATPAGIWLAENAHQYGFILRYPRDKSELTKVIYEPWHYRYVGIPHAQIIYENDICYEEYMSFLQLRGWITYRIPGVGRYDVRHEKTLPAEYEDAIYISNDNMGGYIITYFKPY